MKNIKNNILSPITGSANVSLEDTIDSKYLIESYLEQFKLDISYLFNNISCVYIYKCMDTGYRFYYPLNIAGDDSFYGHLGKLGWYYLPWKWERCWFVSSVV